MADTNEPGYPTIFRQSHQQATYTSYSTRCYGNYLLKNKE